MAALDALPVLAFLASGGCIAKLNRLTGEFLDRLWRLDPAAMKNRPPTPWASGEALAFVLSFRVPDRYPVDLNRLHQRAMTCLGLVGAMFGGAFLFWIGQAVWTAVNGPGR